MDAHAGVVDHRFYNCDGDIANGCETPIPQTSFVLCSPTLGIYRITCKEGYVAVESLAANVDAFK
jgi:hypothetical protein